MRALALLIVAAAAAVPAVALTQAQSDAVTTATAPNEAKSGEADPDDRVRCRRVEVTGSLVKRGRVCRTVREWRTISENGNYNSRKMVEDATSKQSGN